MRCSAEFMIEPWEFGNLDRVDKAFITLAGHGLEVDIGPFANSAQGEAETVLPALVEMLQAAGFERIQRRARLLGAVQILTAVKGNEA